MSRYHEARRVFDMLSQTLVEVRLVADVPDLAGLSLTTTNLDGLPVIGLRESPHFGLNVVVKRAMDIVLSLIRPCRAVAAAGASSPCWCKLTSPGPVFYRQERCGLNGESFQMLKFRSMRVDAENANRRGLGTKGRSAADPAGHVPAQDQPGRIAAALQRADGRHEPGRPAPERPVFIKQFSRTIPNYMARHCVKAGITGWAQVHGWRGNTSLRKRVQYDLYYITHWTPWLDLRILGMTMVMGCSIATRIDLISDGIIHARRFHEFLPVNLRHRRAKVDSHCRVRHQYQGNRRAFPLIHRFVLDD